MSIRTERPTWAASVDRRKVEATAISRRKRSPVYPEYDVDPSVTCAGAAVVDRRTETQQMRELSSDMKPTSALTTITTTYHVKPGNIGGPAESSGQRHSRATIVSRRQSSQEHDDDRRERYRTDIAATISRRIGDGSNERDIPIRETNLNSEDYYEIIQREIGKHRRSKSEDGDNTLSAVVDRRTVDAPGEALPAALKPRERSLSPDDDDDDLNHKFSAAVIARPERKSKKIDNPYQRSAVVTKSERELDYHHDRPMRQSAFVDRAHWGTNYDKPSFQQAVVITRPDPPSKASSNGSKPRYLSKSARKGRASLDDGKSAEVFPVRGVALERTDTGAAEVIPQDRSRGLEENNDRRLCLFCGMGRKSKGLSGEPQDQSRPRTLRSLPPPTRSRVPAPVID